MLAEINKSIHFDWNNFTFDFKIFEMCPFSNTSFPKRDNVLAFGLIEHLLLTNDKKAFLLHEVQKNKKNNQILAWPYWPQPTFLLGRYIKTEKVTFEVSLGIKPSLGNLHY